MPEHIEREAAVKALKENTTEMEGDIYYGSHMGVPEDEIENIINKIPTADVEPVKRGEWVEEKQIGKNSRHIKYTTKICSVCGYSNGRQKKNYCPSCGAKMSSEGTNVPTNNGWISVEDRLPDTEVLCANFKKETYGYGEMIIGFIGYNQEEECYDAESKSEVLENVTHWQPLPEPPKGAEK